MADKLNSGDIFTNPVGNNLVVVDPNKVMGSNGKVVDRLVNAEDLVMYANLTARIYPRSKIIAGASAGDEIKVELFDGELNFLKPGGKKFLDSDWTEGFTDPDFGKTKKSTNKGVSPSKLFDNSKDFGGFGITSISVKVNASYIPQVSINFTDVRGKTLFEQAKTNTPYTAFFHLPYPTFFLTLKGYYGKAVQYQLTLEKFVSRFDPSSGDYLVTCDFKGNHIALLRDINMHTCVTAPYMYPTRVDGDGNVTSTKGRQVMSNVYKIYKNSKLIPNDFPEYTIVELIEKVKSLDGDLGKLYGQKNLTTTTDKLRYEETLDKLKEIFKKDWMMEYLATDLGEDVEIVVNEVDGQGNAKTKKVWTTAYPLKATGNINEEVKEGKGNRTELLATAEEKTLEALSQVVLPELSKLSENNTFGVDGVEDGKYKVNDYFDANKVFNVRQLYKGMKVNGPDGVKVENVEKLKVDSEGKTRELEPWFVTGVAPQSFYGRWNLQKKSFDTKAKEMSEKISIELNARLENYLGFVPTIRNVFAVIVAGADTFLRLLDDVHTKAMRESTNPKRLAVANESNDTAKNNTKNNEICYPWPQYYVVEEEGACGITSAILKYPGATDVIDINESNNKKFWPEVDFVEEYVKSTTYRISDYKFATINTGVSKQFTPINVRDWPSKTAPYITKDNSEFLFEILDRAQAAITFGGLMTRYQGTKQSNLISEALIELAGYEAQNINKQIEDSPNLKEFISSINNFEDIEIKLKSTSPYSFSVYQKFGIVTPFNQKTFNIETIPNNPFEIITKNYSLNSSAINVSKTTGFFDVIPFVFPNTNQNWINDNLSGAKYLTGPGDFFSIGRGMFYDVNDSGVLKDIYNISYLTSTKISENTYTTYDRVTHELSGPISDINKVNEYYDLRSKAGHVNNGGLQYTEGNIKNSLTAVNLNNPPTTANQDIDETTKKLASMLNTPYFINSLLDGVNQDQAGTSNPYTLSSYLLLNSLPLINFREKVSNETDDLLDYVGIMFNQMPALHTVPLTLLLKLGSIWWRYKKNSETGSDPLNSIWSDVGGTPSTVYDPLNNSINTNFTFTGSTDGVPYVYVSENTTNNSVKVGVYPTLISAIHYIATDTISSFTPPIPNSSLNLIFNPLVLPEVDLNLTIENNTTISYISEDTKVEYYNVYLDSKNINDKSLGVKFGNRLEPKRYFILYPSTGGINWTEAPAYKDAGSMNPTTFPNNINSLHNGASRLLWYSTPKGYFQHINSYQPSPNQYFKFVNPSQITGDVPPWSLIEGGGYSTIDELRGVFNNQQLDEFEKMFLEFSNTKSTSSAVTQTLKSIIKEISVVSDIDGLSPIDLEFDSFTAEELLETQAKKFKQLIDELVWKKIDYSHNSTNNLDMIVNGSTVLQNLMGLFGKSEDYDFGTYAQSSVVIPTTPGSGLGLLVQEHIDMKIYVGEHYINGDGLDILSSTNTSNPFYNFFVTARPDGNGITFNSSNIEAFSPIIRMYGTYCSSTPTLNTFPAHRYFKLLVDELEVLNNKEEDYVNAILRETKKKIKAEKNLNKLKESVDPRPNIEANDLKLELYNGFKVMNDRWISGINLTATGGTLFERFLFLDRANRDIGNEAIVNIWDILKLDSPFDDASSKTLTQSISSYLSIILANNYFNFIPLPSYINFFNVEGDNSQLQGNAMFGTFTTVDYLDSKPAFLCQYVGKPSSQLDVKTSNNGYSTDTFNVNNTANNPLLAEECGDRNLSNKVMGFNVDFGIPNQNIFESVTLDQSQYQNTAESYKVLQEMANSGGGGSTTMASTSLYNVYASRSYTAKITCMGNVTIQPTQYFQLRYLPMFNGPYLIINVEHDIRPNTIETSFEGVRVPIPKLPKIGDLVQRVNESLYKEAETNLKQSILPNYYNDGLTATKQQMKLKPEENGYIDSGSTSTSLNDTVIWGHAMDVMEVEYSEDNPLEPHLGLDYIPKLEYTNQASSEEGLYVYPVIDGIVTAVQDGCIVGNTSEKCALGNYIVITKTLQENPVEDETAYYKVSYYFLREGILVSANEGIESAINKSSVAYEMTTLGGTTTMGRKIAKLGNTGKSKGQHLHLEIIRGVQKEGKIVEHILNPRNIIPPWAF